MAVEKRIIPSEQLDVPDPKLPPENLVLLKGKLDSFDIVYTTGFVLEEAYKNTQISNNQKMGAASAAAIAGSGALALNSLTDPNESAQISSTAGTGYMTGTLDGKPLKGFTGYGRFDVGDEVEVVAEWQEDHYAVYAMARPRDKIVAMFVGCARGRKSMLKQYLKAWFWIPLVLYILVYLPFPLWHAWKIGKIEGFVNYLNAYSSSSIGILILLYFFLVGPWIFLLKRQTMKTCVALAERIFTTFGWKNPQSIDLYDITRSRIKHLKRKGVYPKKSKKGDFGVIPYEAAYMLKATHLFYYSDNVDDIEPEKNGD